MGYCLHLVPKKLPKHHYKKKKIQLKNDKKNPGFEIKQNSLFKCSSPKLKQSVFRIFTMTPPVDQKPDRWSKFKKVLKLICCT